MYLYIKGSVTFNHLLGLRNLKVCIALYLCAYLTFGGNDNKVLIENLHHNHHYDDHHHELHLRNVVLLLHAVLPQTLFRQKLVPEKMFFSPTRLLHSICLKKTMILMLIRNSENPKSFESKTNLSCTFLNWRSCLLKETIFSKVSAP